MRNEFIETVKVCDGNILNADMHNGRMWKTSAGVFGCPVDFDVRSVRVPEDYRNGVVKCRILYGSRMNEISFAHYTPRQTGSLVLVDGGGIDYSLKYADRTCLERLLSLRRNCDDVLISVNGCITDTSYSNVIFVNDEGMYTPDTFLLNGTKRRRLLQDGIVAERRITVDDLRNYSYLLLINAMLDIADNVRVDISNIRF